MSDEQTSDPFADFDEARTSSEVEKVDIPTSNNIASNGNGGFSDSLVSEKIKTRNRTFFLDLKKSVNGKFLKISELSRGKKSTIMMDAEDIAGFIESMKKIQAGL